MKKQDILRLIRLNFFMLLGAALGLLLAILLLTLGFWRTLLIVLLVSGGAVAGSFLDRGRRLMDLVDRFFPGGASDDDDPSMF